MSHRKRLVVGISGASGAVLGIRLLEVLAETDEVDALGDGRRDGDGSPGPEGRCEEEWPTRPHARRRLPRLAGQRPDLEPAELHLGSLGLDRDPPAIGG